jgi:hypothetical protein
MGTTYEFFKVVGKLKDFVIYNVYLEITGFVGYTPYYIYIKGEIDVNDNDVIVFYKVDNTNRNITKLELQENEWKLKPETNQMEIYEEKWILNDNFYEYDPNMFIKRENKFNLYPDNFCENNEENKKFIEENITYKINDINKLIIISKVKPTKELFFELELRSEI